MKACERCGRHEDGSDVPYRDRVTVNHVTIVLNGTLSITHLRLCTPCCQAFQGVTDRYRYPVGNRRLGLGQRRSLSDAASGSAEFGGRH